MIVFNQGAIENTVLDVLSIDGRVEITRYMMLERLEWEKCESSDQDAHLITVPV